MSRSYRQCYSSYTERNGLDECERHCSQFVISYCSYIPVDSDTHNPTKAWTKYKNRCKVISITPLSHNIPVPPDKVRFVCLSDTHSQIEKTPHVVPVLLHAVDFTNVGLQKEVEKFNQFLGEFFSSYESLGNKDNIKHVT